MPKHKPPGKLCDGIPGGSGFPSLGSMVGSCLLDLTALPVVPAPVCTWSWLCYSACQAGLQQQHKQPQSFHASLSAPAPVAGVELG